MPTRPLTIWAVSDGRAGIQNQVLGLAEAVQRLTPADIFVKRIKYRLAFDWLPVALKLAPDAMLAKESDNLAAPWPDIWIGAGRATLPHAMRMRKRSGGKTLVVQLQDPAVDLTAFDLVIAPEHDGLSGANVLSLTGSTHRVTAERLKAESHAFSGVLEGHARPYVTALIGGNSKAHALSAERAHALATQVKDAVLAIGGTLLLTFSRRPPTDARAAFTAAIEGVPMIAHGNDGANPYFAFLNAADFILVTEDSVNMAVEAAATGSPVYILSLDHRKSGRKFLHFHKGLRENGIARPFDGRLESWAYSPLVETERAAKAVLERLSNRGRDATG